MLNALVCLAALTIPPPDGLPAFTSPEQVVDLLGSMGYAVTLPAPGQGWGTLVHEGVTIGVGFARTAGDAAKGVPDTYSSMLLSLELASPGVRPAGRPWSPQESGVGAAPPEFVAHLGGTATETARIDLARGATKGAIRKGLEEFWIKGQAFAKAHGVAFAPAPAFDPKTTKLDDALTLDRADQESFRRAILAWGWSLPQVPGYASQGWIMPIETGGRAVWLRQRVEGVEALPQAVDVMRLDPKPTTENLWASRKSERDPMPSVVYAADGMHLLVPSGTLDLAKGVTLGELRRRLAAFAATAG